MLTARGKLALALGVGVYVGARAFGSEPLYPVAIGLLLAVGVAWAWVSLLDKPMELQRSSPGGDHVEGDDVVVALELRHAGPLRPATLPLLERISRVGDVEVRLRRAGTKLTGRYVLRSLPRGRYVVESTTAIVEDPFGLARADVPLRAGGAILVYPRLVELEGVFSESGAYGHDGRRLLLRRPSGFDLHSVRPYEQGESLRRVHWKSTARRGELMVKDLEDTPRDEVAVLLDAAADAVVGTPPESTFDVQVRAAGSILLAHARRGRKSLLAVNSAGRDARAVSADDADWRGALEMLAALEATAETPVHALLAEDASRAARALELTVVTARVTPELVDRLLQRVLRRRPVALVHVDAATFAGRSRRRPDTGLLRLAAAGVPVVELARGDDLASKLSRAGLLEARLG